MGIGLTRRELWRRVRSRRRRLLRQLRILEWAWEFSVEAAVACRRRDGFGKEARSVLGIWVEADPPPGVFAQECEFKGVGLA